MSKVFQNLIIQIKELYSRNLGTIDAASGSITSTLGGLISSEAVENALTEYTNINAFYSNNNITYKPTGTKNAINFITFCEGVDETARTCCSVLAIAISSIKNLHDEKFDKGNLIKNILLDNILPSDIYEKAMDLHIQIDAPRVVYSIKMENAQVFPQVIISILQQIFPDKNKNFAISIDENTVALLQEVKENSTVKDFEATAKRINDTITAETLTKLHIGIGSMYRSIKDISHSYREANIAIEISQVFESDKQIISYENLSIGRLVYQLPTTLCSLFLSEVFKKEGINSLDNETLLTINQFFKHNLNVSETARTLFVHRNTLVYRLDKVEKLTGLDLREFDQAVVFKVAMMVNQYLNSSKKY